MQWINNLLSSEDQKGLFKKLFLFSAIFHLIAVIFSEGFHRPDEHLGMMRFVSFKLGQFPIDELSWEYPAKIRPWLQPAMYLGLAKVFNFFGGESPFKLALLFRLFSSLIGFYSLYLTAKISLQFFKDKYWQNLTVFGLCTLWFLPFFQARTTAESFGISFFIFALYPLMMKIPRENLLLSTLKPTLSNKQSNLSIWGVSQFTALLIGLSFGASFIFRFQMAFMTFFTLLWFFLYSRIKISNLIMISLGVFMAMGLNVLIDFWGYGEWTFSAWNYLYQNIFKGVASGFGVSPWYYYLNKTLMKGIPTFSLIMIIPTIWLWIKRPGSILAWITLPYFAIHSLVGHKELRFIFAMGLFCPVILAYYLESKPLEKFKNQKWFRVLLTLAIIQNFAALAISSFKPAYSPINFYKHLYSKKETITQIYTLAVFRDQLKFYLKNPIKQIVEEDRSKIKTIISNSSRPTWFLTNKFHDIQLFRNEYKNCTEDYISYPNWVFKFNYKNWLRRSKIWALYKCK